MGGGLYSLITRILGVLAFLVWDTGLTIINFLSSSRPRGAVVPQGCKGHGGTEHEMGAEPYGEKVRLHLINLIDDVSYALRWPCRIRVILGALDE